MASKLKARGRSRGKVKRPVEVDYFESFDAPDIPLMRSSSKGNLPVRHKYSVPGLESLDLASPYYHSSLHHPRQNFGTFQPTSQDHELYHDTNLLSSVCERLDEMDGLASEELPRKLAMLTTLAVRELQDRDTRSFRDLQQQMKETLEKSLAETQQDSRCVTVFRSFIIIHGLNKIQMFLFL